MSNIVLITVFLLLRLYTIGPRIYIYIRSVIEHESQSIIMEQTYMTYC